MPEAWLFWLLDGLLTFSLSHRGWFGDESSGAFIASKYRDITDPKS